jgi:two-component system cell cycle response regulator
MQQEQDIVAGMEAGADDYITKPFKDNELRVRLRAGRRIIDLQNELIAAREALRLRATHDPLTGLWNHEEILDILKQELDRANREGLAVSVVMADIDHFKKVNDTYGHMTGDAVLRTTARRLQEAVRSYDSIGRYGGEEFLIVLPGCAGPNSAASAERLLHCIGNKAMDTPEGMIQITVSLGIAGTGEGMLLDADALVKAADLALYQAKENGRNRFEIASGTPNSYNNATIHI